MFAGLSVLSFVVALILDLADTGGSWVGRLVVIGLALLAAHHAFGSRVLNAPRL